MKPILIGPQGFVEIKGESIYFESYGEGETIVLCHGKGGNHAIWYQQVPILAQQYRVVTWDQRGFGRSSNRLGKAGPPAAAEDLQALLDHLKVDQAHLIGQSMGGWAVMESTLRWPERTKSLILADTLAGLSTLEIEAEYAASRARRYAKPADTHLSMDGHAIIAADSAEKNMTRAFLYNQIGRSNGLPPDDAGQLIQRKTYGLEQVGAMKTPTLFIVGEKDLIFSPDMIRKAAALLPHAQVIEIPEADHSPYFETPERWNEVVMAFLESSPLT
ncbi:MAG: 3-oxoadipate enol-lactonase [Cellvibrionaceae bacterium]|jgi:3-oxoadipate enol-lactonase